jgi:uncharacterized protein (DUF697 family)
MTITRARKMPKTAPRAENVEITPEQFIAAADTPSAPLPASLPMAAIASREERALAVVKSYLPWAAGAGILPLPAIDVALIMGVQLRMLAKLAEVYSVPFKEQAAKSIVAALMAMLVQNILTGGLVSALKFVPVVGTLLAIAVLPAVAAAGTFSIGKVFITHFEAGGTFLDFDPQKMRNHFRVEFEKARTGSIDRSGT